MHNKKLIEDYINHYNSKNIDCMLELFSDDAQFESVSNTDGIINTYGKRQLRELAETSIEYFEQRRQTVLSWVIGDSHVAIEIDYWCKLAKDFPDGKKAGEEMQLRGASFFTVEAGRISRLVDYM
jgi:ketosteroid isomerase-like protein